MLLLTQPWTGAADPVGVACALGAAVCWAAYILLTQRVGDAVAGSAGWRSRCPSPRWSRPWSPAPGVVGRLTPELLLVGLGLAILLPVVPFTLELLALRRLTTGAFGTLMALEPAFALVIGFLVLQPGARTRSPSLGIGLVVAAGIGAERTGARADAPAPSTGRAWSRPDRPGAVGHGKGGSHERPALTSVVVSGCAGP